MSGKSGRMQIERKGPAGSISRQTDLPEERGPLQLTPSLRVVAVVSVILGCTGVVYWVPALSDLPSAAAAPSDHPVAMVQRVVDLAAQQFTPPVRWVVPVLGAFFTVSSTLQVPAGIVTLMGREWGVALLRVVGYSKIAMFIAAGMLLGLALFSDFRPQDASWRFSAVSWLAITPMIALYWWIIRVVNAVLPPMDGIAREGDDFCEEEEA